MLSCFAIGLTLISFPLRLMMKAALEQALYVYLRILSLLHLVHVHSHLSQIGYPL